MKPTYHLPLGGWLVLALLLLACGFLTSCAATRSKSADGATYTSVSVLENAAEKSRSWDPMTGLVTERVIGQNQTDGAKVIAGGIVTVKGVEATKDFMMARLGKEQAIETATIAAGKEIDLAREANRSAEVLATIPPVE